VNEEKVEIDNIVELLKTFDVVFPVLHGLYGEDGTIQGMFELFKIPYIGCKVLASSVGMDKVYTKIIFDKANINQAKYTYIRKYKENYIYIIFLILSYISIFCLINISLIKNNFCIHFIHTNT